MHVRDLVLLYSCTAVLEYPLTLRPTCSRSTTAVLVVHVHFADLPALQRTVLKYLLIAPATTYYMYHGTTTTSSSSTAGTIVAVLDLVVVAVVQQ